MFTLLSNARIYSPDDLGVRQLLVCRGEIIALDEQIPTLPFPVTHYDCRGKIIIPGIIDQHIHLTGGGGEAGFASRTPQASFSALIAAGITTVVGVLGTDGISRSPKDLYAKMQALNSEGLRAYMHTGSYELPTRTITGNVRDDIAFIPHILGVKIALADHRSSFPSHQELLRLVSDIRVAALLAGKKGVLHVHMGGLPEGLEPLVALCDAGLPIHHLSPTHVARTRPLFDQAISFALRGGTIDVTSGGSRFAPQEEAVAWALEAGVPHERITISSDGNGSVPRFNAQGQVEGLSAAPVNGNISLLPRLINQGVEPHQAIAMMTANVASSLGIAGGRLQPGERADICVLNEDFSLAQTFAAGRLVYSEGECLVRGNFE
ncbi:beta-aspartyl-peptidase [Shimwellia blattae]|uniref:Isoaspartyl dipeptidase n=1 Tax=Shimwellia blattae (strain ATCC 29907 / DSM 4481 / JCM 1650 / NBRC 105725 / CDC 9005-74) TaxID=630626 RepID=I2B4S9_SHIBC|nr:beta-aspartyl-peptidase [Shimwellia blattae]AFJ45533.1 isoaspartyl dipeptidase [Shimwellia blattae DSM 4481 = NBRC 105725]GAB81526.1 isoaspartyl dipeptidase [Shimwellia blattae DSM 4481 = NBRC 105725]VDY63017.1 Isoaspartyl dipeptidase [Shimwellia blattae]VEC20133.1 Isoaspartyl dipeptidase [Shimwellia blattae]